MDLPSLPLSWAKDNVVLEEYDKWRDEALRSGKTAEELHSEFFARKNGVRNRLLKMYVSRNAFADQDGELKERNELLDVGDVFDAIPKSNKKDILSIEVRLNREGGKELRKPMRFNVYHERVPNGLLAAGRDGIEVGSRDYNRFGKLLNLEADDDNGGAKEVLKHFGERSAHGQYIQTLFLNVISKSPVSADTPRVPLNEMNYGLTSLATLLSHKFLTAKVEVKDDTFQIVPSEELSQSLLDYFKDNHKEDACAYDAVIEGLKESWDKHYKKNSDKLSHKLIRRELGKSVDAGWKLKLTELEAFFSNPDRKLSCVILDIWGNVIWKYVWNDVWNDNIHPRTLYLMAHNEHVWRISTEARSVANSGMRDKEVVDGDDAVPKVKDPSPFYSVLPELNEKWTEWKLCDDWDDVDKEIRKIPDMVAKYELKKEVEVEDEEEVKSHKKKVKPKLVLHYSGNMELLFHRFYNDKRYECEIVVRDNHVVELRLNLQAFVRILTFSVDGQPCLVRKPKPSTDLKTTAIAGQEDYDKFLPVMASAKKSFIHRDWISHYSTGLQRAFDQLGRGQLVRNFVEGEHTGVGIDIRSFYPSLLCEIEELPVFSYMSDFRVFVKGTEIEPHSFYIVENQGDDPETYIILNRRINLVSGWTLLNCELPPYHYNILAVVHPVSLEENTFPLCVEQVKKSLGNPLTDTAKFILNSLIGLTGKRVAQNTSGRWTASWEEAHARTSDPRDIYPFAEGHIAVSRSKEVLLENGFFPAQFLVYDRARVALLKLFRQLKKAGCVVYGVKTDCFIVDKVPADFPLVKDGRLVENFGKYHKEDDEKKANHPIMFVNANDAFEPVLINTSWCKEPEDCELVDTITDRIPIPIPIYSDFQYHTLTKTHSFQGNNLVIVEDGTMVLGACAGSGKTTCCSASCSGKTLIVVPTNKRVDEFETEWKDTLAFRSGTKPSHKSWFNNSVSDVEVITNAQFLSKRIDEAGEERKKNKERDISQYDTIFIDEFFQSSTWDIIAIVKRLIKLRKEQLTTDEGIKRRYYEKRRENTNTRNSLKELAELKGLKDKLFSGRRTKIFANGDTFQLANHESWNYFGDKQAFCDTFLWRVFPKRVFLEENFRLIDENERPVLMKILKQLKEGRRKDEELTESNRKFILRVLKDNGLKDQIFINPDEVIFKGDEEPMPCITWTNVMGNAVNQRFCGEEQIGMKVVCRDYMMTTKKNDEGKEVKIGLRMNKVYKVLDIKNGLEYLIESDGDKQYYPRIKFRPNVAMTAHAVQGEKIAKNFAIFEWAENYDWRWVYVALSRAVSLKQAWFYDGVPLFNRRDLKDIIREKLSDYEEQDKKAGRSIENFITENWVMEKLKEKNFICGEQTCMRPMSLQWNEQEKDEEYYAQFTIDRKNNDLGHVLWNCRITCLRCNLAAAHEAK
jgi:hypothetical protein